MIPVIIGISGALLQIIVFEILRQFNKKRLYALELAGIGFLYVGFTWTNTPTLIIASIQAIIFLMIAYYGLAKNLYILAIGYFMHGMWDISYNFWQDNSLIPPHYDLFCMSLDFVLGAYLTLKVLYQKNISQAAIITQ